MLSYQKQTLNSLNVHWDHCVLCEEAWKLYNNAECYYFTDCAGRPAMCGTSIRLDHGGCGTTFGKGPDRAFPSEMAAAMIRT